ncbi:hypothetical protein [Nocardia cyriacigeorgica]|uniref:hypothetical protein n=1 Tax=Nocardia cyriacigeorgica TaxID=135487 RepID=UPI00245466E6|nr:hypothetical protein [Nocardia cyriacigeorgica]
MKVAEVIEALKALLRIQPNVTAGSIEVYLPELDDTVTIDVAEVQRYRRIWAPNGDPALEFVIGSGQEVRPLIITPDDVVFQPLDTGVLLDFPIEFSVVDAPHIVAYTEMERAAERIAGVCERPGPIELGSVAAAFLLVRCYVAAAVRAGMRPVRSVAWWQRGWSAVGGDVPLPPFRFDPMWDELTHEATELVLDGEGPKSPWEGVVPELTVADFQRLEPALTAVGLDQEFVGCWTASISVTPAKFTEVLLDQLDSGRAYVTLYPEGSGSVDITVQGGAEVAILQISWCGRDELQIDEIRIPDALAHTGLFQRLMFNTTRIAKMLGFERVSLLATGVGAYAFAATGYPRDPELRRTQHRGR